jgi:CMP-N,N'-diacetyllegionaminic acid synthase
MHILSVIPARGGSKSIPMKNIYPLLGKPLIGYTIEHALCSKKIDRVLVSTDNREIARVAEKFGAEVPFSRPNEHGEDKTPDFPVFFHALSWLKENEGYEPDIVVHLRPTSPIRNVQHIDHMIQLLMDNPYCDSVRSVSAAKQSPYKMWKQEGEHIVPLFEHPYNEKTLTAKQYLPNVLFHNGCIDVIRTSTILIKESLTGEVILPFLMADEKYDVQIDSRLDAKIAGMILETA